MRLWYIHGNWQTPEVWNPIIERVGRYFEGRSLVVDQVAVDYWETSAQDLDEWAKSFVTDVRSESRSTSNVLIGYSMGGRMAMHALVQDPDLWAGAILVASDPGTSKQDLRAEQLARDKKWAEELRCARLEDVVREWDALPIFGGIKNRAPRNLSLLNADRVADIMVRFSKGAQADLFDSIVSCTVPVTYISGSIDKKYNAIGVLLEASSQSIKHITVDAAGHRVPWEATEQFVAEVVCHVEQHYLD